MEGTTAGQKTKQALRGPGVLFPDSDSPRSFSQRLSSKYPKVQELLLGKRARCYLLPKPGRQWVNKGHGSPGGGECPCGQRPPAVAPGSPAPASLQPPKHKEFLPQMQMRISATFSSPTSPMS